MMNGTPQLVTVALISMLGGGPACDAPRDIARAEDLPIWTLVEEVRIGSIDHPDQALTEPLLLVSAPDGDLFIGQPGAGEIRQYDASGQRVRTIGRRGHGPGEFSTLLTIGLLGDTLYVIKRDPARLSLFTLAGELLGTSLFELDPPDGVNHPQPPFRLFPDGTGVTSPGTGIDARARGVDQTVFHRTDRRGRVQSTLYSHASPSGLALPMAGGGSIRLNRPLTDFPFLAFSQDGARFAVLDRPAAQRAEGAEFRVTEMTLAGDTLSSVAYPYRPIPVPQETADSLMKLVVRSAMRGLGTRRDAERAVHSALRLPNHYPPVTSMGCSPDLSLWLGREEVPGQDRHWEVISRGERIARVGPPDRVRVILVLPEHVWGLEHDELDVPYVVRYRIVRDPSPRDGPLESGDGDALP